MREPIIPHFIVRTVKPNDKDYPICMELVPHKENYDLIAVDNLIVVPLVQVIDKLSEIEPDEVIRHGKRICPRCGAELEATK